MNLLYEYKELLSKIEIGEIVKRIEEYRKLDLKKISDQELVKGILKTISVKSNGREQAILFPRISLYPPKTRFYRVRKIKPEDHYIPLKAMTCEEDAWNPPSQLITKRGRLNNIKESLLYTSPIYPCVAVEEMKIEDDERFCLIVYEAKSEIKVSLIGQWEDIPEWTKEENLKMRIIHNFLHDEFTRDVGEGTEYLYRASERIAKDYFDLPPRDIQDAWCYPSIAAKGFVNVCFRPDLARELLDLLGVQICNVKRKGKNYLFKCEVIACGFDKEKKFQYYPVNSPICNSIFPEIQLTNKN